MEEENLMSEPHKKEEIKWTKRRVGPPYTALTLDTCIYERHGFRFGSGLLEKLQHQPIQIVIPEIVYREVLNHLDKRGDRVSKSMKSVLSDFQNRYSLGEIPMAQFESVKNVVENALPLTNQFYLFVGSLKDHLRLREFCSIEHLVRAYFAATPPFVGPGKKNEFPDAIALFSLEQWARQNGKKILAVSTDEGWLSFSEKSLFIDVVSDLESGLQEIQETTKEIRSVFHQYLSSISRNKALAKQVDQHLGPAIRESYLMVDIDVDNMKSMPDRLTDIGAKFTSFDYMTNTLSIPESEMERDLTIVSCSAKNTSFAVDAYIDVDTQAEVDLYLVSDEKLYRKSLPMCGEVEKVFVRL
ncbi:MAG: PIN domain-containing protein, partial [Candidatus Dadabacteria bacterium]|nr:PIN domain-containing protein [Candidatus Dadabacteria bacterium]